MKHGGPFNSVGSLRPKRNFFNLSHFKLFACDFGELIPALKVEVVPGDKFKISNQIVIRTQPLFAPILQPIKVYTEYFFVPNRLVFDDWKDFISGGKDGDFSTELPRWNNIQQNGILNESLNSLGDLMTIATGVDIPYDDIPNALAQRAYNLIFNEYYRDETIDDEVDLFNDTILKRRWKKDYFTSALPFQQRGVQQVVPIFADGLGFSLKDDAPDRFAPLTFDSAIGTTTYINTHGTEYRVANFPGVPGTGSGGPVGIQDPKTYDGVVSNFNKRFGTFVQNGSEYYWLGLGTTAKSLNDNIKVNTDNMISGFTIAELRLSVQIQKFLERNARSGYRLNEFLLAHFGISPRDAVLQRPEYIGGSRSDLLVSEVLQTSESTSESPQGKLAGRGLSVSSQYISTYTCSEHGYIIGLFSVMPQCMYDSQGIDKEFTRRSAFDFYFPEFAHLSEQPIKSRELVVTDDHDQNEKIFGYQPIYQEYRHIRNQVTSYFRVGEIYENWTMARHFTEPPTLSSDFLEVDADSSRIFAVNAIKPLMVDFGNIVKAIRPIPKSGEPGLVDHF